MKSFSTSTFGALTSLSFLLATVQAAVFPRDGLPPINVPTNPVPEYFKLMDKCNADNTTPVAILYAGGEEITYAFDECIPKNLGDNNPAQMPVLCKAVTCKVYHTNDCTEDATLPISIPFLGGLPIINPFDVVQLLGGSAICKAL